MPSLTSMHGREYQQTAEHEASPAKTPKMGWSLGGENNYGASVVAATDVANSDESRRKPSPSRGVLR